MPNHSDYDRCPHCGAHESELHGALCPKGIQLLAATSPADILADMANTYRERNAVYGDNWKNVGQVMMSLFPDGVHLGTAKAFNEWHLFELIVVKLTRFANSKLTHADSIHDIAVYAAMIEAAIKEKKP